MRPAVPAIEPERWPLGSAALVPSRMKAARVKRAPGRWIRRARQIASQHDARASPSGLGLRHGREQGHGVRMSRRAQYLLGGALLDDPAEIHHGDAMRDLAHHGEVVRDEEIGETPLALQVGEQVEHLRLYRHVQRRHRLVADDERRLDRERARDPDPLPLAAGELVRIAPGVGSDRGRPPRAGTATRRPISAPAARRWISIPSAIAAPTVMRGLSELYGSWKMICIRRRSVAAPSGPARRRRAPRTAPMPLVGSCSRRIVRPTEDFPQPDSPTSASVSPAARRRTIRRPPRAHGARRPEEPTRRVVLDEVADLKQRRSCAGLSSASQHRIRCSGPTGRSGGIRLTLVERLGAAGPEPAAGGPGTRARARCPESA